MKKILGIRVIPGVIFYRNINHNKEMNTIKLTPEINKIIENLNKLHVFDGINPLDISRKGYETMAIQLGGKKEAVKMIEEFNIRNENHEIPVRIYRPNGIMNEKSPAIIYLHGGWFISGSFETHDTIVRQLANVTSSVIVFVDYRLAPEHPFPAGFDDAQSATEWILNNSDALNIDKNKVGIIGDSAGAALAIGVSTRLGQQLRFQVLIYPAADNQLNTQSWKDYEYGPIINKDEGIKAWNWYLNDSKDQQNPMAIPLLIKDFKNTPPTFILLAEHDPLRDEGKQLAQNMKVSEIRVKITHYKEMVHGFMHMGAVLKETREAVLEIAAFARENLK